MPSRDEGHPSAWRGFVPACRWPRRPTKCAGSPVAARVASALQSNIRVVACENTMAGQHLQKSDMLPEIGYVPAGVVELMKKQQQGWAYIRP